MELLHKIVPMEWMYLLLFLTCKSSSVNLLNISSALSVGGGVEKVVKVKFKRMAGAELRATLSCSKVEIEVTKNSTWLVEQ